MIDTATLALLACPNCDDRPALRLEDNALVCTVCGRVYPIVDDIPHLLPESGQLPESTKA